MLRAEIVGLKELERDMGRAVVKFPDQLQRNVRKALFIVKKRVYYYLSGRRSRYAGLAERSGKLKRSIYAKIIRGINGVIGTKVPYAKFWELEEGQFASGHVRHIYPVHAKVLRFTVNGRVVFAMHVKQEGPRFFLRVALKDEEDQITKLIGKTVEEAFK